MSRRDGGSRVDRHGRSARVDGKASRVATRIVAVVLALVVGTLGGIVLYLALGAL